MVILVFVLKNFAACPTYPNKFVIKYEIKNDKALPAYPILPTNVTGNKGIILFGLRWCVTYVVTAGQGHEILRFCEFRCLTGSSLCSLLLLNYSTDFSNDDANLLREQCRCAICTSF